MNIDLKPKWRCIGPFRGGRVGAVAGDVKDANTFYFAACAGGVWKSTDAGLYWENVSDGFFSSSSMGAIAVSEADPNVIYVGSGESTTRSDIEPGDGIYKSIDAGRSWQHIGLRDSRHIGKLAIHPQNPDIVYAAALGHVHGSNPERGVFRSTNGGLEWKRILYKSDKAGAIDVRLDPQNPRFLLAAIWEMKRSFYDISSGGEDCGLYRSFDGGDSWEEITVRHGLPGGLLGKMAVAISPAQSGRVWALIESAVAPGLYRSDNYGDTWELVSDDSELNGRAWYYTHLTADPQYGDTLYVNCYKLWKSTDGGHHFTQINTRHGDNHDIWLDPNNNQRMIQGNDGGASVSLNGGRSWSSVFNQPTAQIYRICTDNQTPYHVYGTQQDHTCVAVPSNDYYHSAISWASCYKPGTGESGHVAVRPDNSEIVYSGALGSSPGGGNSLQRYDHRTKQIRLITPWPETKDGLLPSAYRYRFNWTYPILVSRHDPNTIYIGAQVVLRSQDEGQSWQEISPDLTRADPKTFLESGGPINKEGGIAEMYATILALAESSLDGNVLWAGSDDGLIHLSQDAGASWTNVTPAIMPDFLQISTVEPSPFDAGTAYVAGTRNLADDFRPYLFKTTDFGASWMQITEGIPEHDFTRVIRVDPARSGLLYAGTATTVYVSINDGAQWHSLTGNLPVAPVYDLRVTENDLVAGTHGRSMWILDDVTPLQQLKEGIGSTKVFLFKPRDATRTLPSIFQGWSGGSQGKNYEFADGCGFYEVDSDQGTKSKRYLDAGENGPAGALIHYWLAEPEGPISLTISDSAGNMINDFQSKGDDWQEGEFLPAVVGFNRFHWNLRYADGTAIKGKDLAATPATGPMVTPGDYTLKLTVGDESFVQMLLVVSDPRIEATWEELQAQTALLLSIRDKLAQAHKLINQARDVRSQIEVWLRRLSAHEHLRESGRLLLQKLRETEDPLLPVGVTSRPEVINAGARLLAQLAALTPVVDKGDFAPTAAAQQFFIEISAEIDVHLNRLRSIIVKDVESFEEALSKAGFKRIVI